MSATAPELSVVIPFYNETLNVAPLLAEVQNLLASLAVTAEVVCIDDGSGDLTAAELAAGARSWSSVRVEHFEKNRGQAAALRRGFQMARAAVFYLTETKNFTAFIKNIRSQQYMPRQ